MTDPTAPPALDLVAGDLVAITGRRGIATIIRTPHPGARVAAIKIGGRRTSAPVSRMRLVAEQPSLLGTEPRQARMF